MKKLLILLLLFSACSTTEDSPEQKWINSVYEQGWYWPAILSDPNDPPRASNKEVPFESDGSFVAGSFTPWNPDRTDLPVQGKTTFILDEVLNNTYAYYRFTYKFNGENLTLYQGLFHGTLDKTGEPIVAWAYLKAGNEPPDSGASKAVLKAWLLETYSKGNFGNTGNALGLKKRGRTTTGKSTTVENYIPNNSNAPTSANTSGTIKN